MPDRGVGDFFPTGRTIPEFGAAERAHQRNLPSASAQTLENTVTQIIEQNMTGLDNMMYMSSQSTNTGGATVTLTFEAGTDPNEAMQQVQNQLQAAIKRLPQAVQNQGSRCRNPATPR